MYKRFMSSMQKMDFLFCFFFVFAINIIKWHGIFLLQFIDNNGKEQKKNILKNTVLKSIAWLQGNIYI